MTDDRVMAIEKAGRNLRAKTQSGKTLETDHVLMAIGRTPNTEGIGLVEAGVELDSGGAIKVDRYSRTTVDHIYAIGDVTNRLNLTPVAIREGQAVADNLFGGKRIAVDHQDVPHAVFGIPEIGVVGLTEEAARAEGRSLKVGRFPYQANGKAIALGETEGLIKTIFDADSGELLGAHMIGTEVTELIQGFAIAKGLETTEAELMATIFPHPTLSEMMHESVLDAYARALHI
jgi:dihydrolipoamide dehydrogenase